MNVAADPAEVTFVGDLGQHCKTMAGQVTSQQFAVEWHIEVEAQSLICVVELNHLGAGPTSTPLSYAAAEVLDSWAPLPG